jgi:PilZ domain
MSALETTVERRAAERVRPATPLRVTFGRGDGSVVDLSHGGMRVRHTVAAMRGVDVRVSFEWQKERFVAMAEVLASRVTSLGTPTKFDTRLRFKRLERGSKELLARVMTTIHSRELRRWIANLQGWSDEVPVASDNSGGDGAFLRCRLIGTLWQTTWTHDSTHPMIGFTVPSTISKLELETLCDTYLHANSDERHLIRLMADEAVRESSVF